MNEVGIGQPGAISRGRFDPEAFAYREGYSSARSLIESDPELALRGLLAAFDGDKDAMADAAIANESFPTEEG